MYVVRNSPSTGMYLTGGRKRKEERPREEEEREGKNVGASIREYEMRKNDEEEGERNQPFIPTRRYHPFIHPSSPSCTYSECQNTVGSLGSQYVIVEGYPI
jgi:hypothetical protein